MSLRRFTLFSPVLAALFGACSSQHGLPYVEDDGGADGDSDSDADGDADGDAGGPDWACPAPADAGCVESHAYVFWGVAASFGEGLGFTDLEGYGTFLADRPDGAGDTEPVLVARSRDQSFEDLPGEHIVAALGAASAEPLRAVALVSPSEIWDPIYGFNAEGPVVGYPAVALLCGDSGCALYGVVADSIAAAHLAAIPNGEVPFPEVRGLVHLTAEMHEVTPEDPVCAFGDGIACFDGMDWTTVLEPGGPLLLAATLGWEDSSSPYLVAAGEACRLVRQTEDGFEEIPLGCDVELNAVSAGFDLFAAGGEGILVLGFPEETLECPMDGVDIAQLRGLSYSYQEEMHRWVTAFAQDGRVIEVRYFDTESTSCTFAEPLDGPARAWTEISPGDDANGSMVVTESSAYWRIEFGGPPMD